MGQHGHHCTQGQDCGDTTNRVCRHAQVSQLGNEHSAHCSGRFCLEPAETKLRVLRVLWPCLALGDEGTSAMLHASFSDLLARALDSNSFADLLARVPQCM
jgi:hypothetical protein